MAGASNGYRVAQVRRPLTPGLTSSLPGMAELPPFISFSTRYPELDSAVRRLMRRKRVSRYPGDAHLPFTRRSPHPVSTRASGADAPPKHLRGDTPPASRRGNARLRPIVRTDMPRPSEAHCRTSSWNSPGRSSVACADPGSTPIARADPPSCDRPGLGLSGPDSSRDPSMPDTGPHRTDPPTPCYGAPAASAERQARGCPPCSRSGGRCCT
jgi:hypothetical protein